MPTPAPRPRRTRARAPAPASPRLTPAFSRALCDAAGLADAPVGRRRALLAAVRAQLARYDASARQGEARAIPAVQRAAIGELMRAAEALLRAFGDIDPATAPVLTDGPGGIDTAAWSRDLHGLWDRLIEVDRRFDARQHSPGASLPDPATATVAGLIEVYKAHAGTGGDLLMFLRQSCAYVSLPLPKTDQKLITLIARLPTLA